MRLRIACLIASVSRKAGGLHESVRRLCQAMHSQPGAEIHVLGLEDEFTREDLAAWAPLPVHVFPVYGPRRFGYAPGLKKKLFELDFDIVLNHGLWMYPTVACLAWHRRTGRPFMVHSHGMLDAWAVRHSYWKKWIAGFLYENESLRQAACLRALCGPEADSIRSFGLRNPVCIIPNGIDLPPAAAGAGPPPWAGRVAAGRRALLYLGRLHPKKGLPELLQAWARLRPGHEWDLVIAGWDQNNHQRELKKRVRELGLAGIHFIGPQFGEGKAAAYRHADAFVLPSHSEGLPMTVLEAWAYGLPVLMTPPCHLPEGFEAGAALCAEPEPDSLARGLETLFSMDPAERKRMGGNGRRLVEEHFNWTQIGAHMYKVCRWLLGRAPRPKSLVP